MSEIVGKTRIASISLGSPCTFDLRGDHLVGRFLGLIPICKFHLGAVHYLRLATKNEVSALYFLLNWPQMLLSSKRSVCPVYILRTRKGQKIFLKMGGSAHFRLRQAIGRHSDRRTQKRAA